MSQDAHQSARVLVFQGKAKCRAGTFNVRSLRSKIKRTTIVKDFESYQLDVLGLTETWVEDAGVDTLDNGHVVSIVPVDRRHELV